MTAICVATVISNVSDIRANRTVPAMVTAKEVPFEYKYDVCRYHFRNASKQQRVAWQDFLSGIFNKRYSPMSVKILALKKYNFFTRRIKNIRSCGQKALLQATHCRHYSNKSYI